MGVISIIFPSVSMGLQEIIVFFVSGSTGAFGFNPFWLAGNRVPVSENSPHSTIDRGGYRSVLIKSEKLCEARV